MTETTELTVPDGGVTEAFVVEVREAMSWRRPVSQNAIWNCLGWAIGIHAKHQKLLEQLREFVTND